MTIQKDDPRYVKLIKLASSLGMCWSSFDRRDEDQRIPACGHLIRRYDELNKELGEPWHDAHTLVDCNCTSQVEEVLRLNGKIS